MTTRQARKMANAIADDLFTHGSGENINRLVCEIGQGVGDNIGRTSGGCCKEVVRDMLCDVTSDD